MTRYVLRRLLYGATVLVAVSIATFVLAELAPGDVLAEMRLDPRISEEALRALEARYGLDRPLYVRYWSWLRSMATGELGHSFAYDVPVGTLLWPRARNTLFLAAAAMALAWLVAVPLGARAAWAASGLAGRGRTATGDRRPQTRYGRTAVRPYGRWWRIDRATVRPGGWLDRLSQTAATVPLALPDLVVGLGCLLLAARTGLFPVGGMVSLDFAERSFPARIGDLLWHLILPAGALAASQLPVLLRHAQAAFADALAMPYLRSARGHGIPRRRLLLAYALPAAVHPLANLFGLSIARLVSGSLVIEVILSWPGMGPLMLEAILARDLHVVVGATLMSSAFLVAGNLVADVLVFAIDPRVRAGEAA